ncbi:MAG: hypothetical protein JW797_01925 [Bradymonadales bacterium]|nr:hypothetical protein [Bradymonadales bacterium]
MDVEYPQFTPDSLLERIRAFQAQGQHLFTWSCNVFSPRLLRVAIFKLDGLELPVLLDQGIIPVPDFHQVKGSILQAGMLGGRWDPVWVGRWDHVWTEGSDPFRLWDRERLMALIDEHQSLVLGDRVIPREAIQSVELFASENWVTRGLRLVLVEGDPVVIASQQSQLPLTLSDYDALDLERETMWAGSLAAEIARRLGRPYVESI